jgi:predicted Fe-Mo cluster-binding NifX family protein
MTIVVSTVSPDLDAGLDPRFGRAAYFLIVDEATLAWEATANPAVEAMGGAGSQAAQLVAKRHPRAVISGAFGPNAFQVLRAAGISMFPCPGDMTARQAVEAYRAGRLQPIEAPTRGGHRA